MNNINEKQHYVSQVLQRRFKTANKPLRRYLVEKAAWEDCSAERAFSAEGYNQLLAGRKDDNWLEAEFQKVESHVLKVCEELGKAAVRHVTTLDESIYRNMCRYCSFLNIISPAAKAGAVPSLLEELNLELANGGQLLLKWLEIPDDKIEALREHYKQGQRLIIGADNVLQIAHNMFVASQREMQYRLFGAGEWTIANSRIVLPLSDVALVPIHQKSHMIIKYTLPIGPYLLLECRLRPGEELSLEESSWKQTVTTRTLRNAEAEGVVDIICASAIRELVCSETIKDVNERRKRARMNGITFNRSVNPKAVAEAGLIKTDGNLVWKMVSPVKYAEYAHSFVLPPE